MKVSRVLLILICIMICFEYLAKKAEAFSDISECLITNDIGIFSYKSQRENLGEGSGLAASLSHFDKDHVDTVCTGVYSNINQIRGLPHEELRQKLISIKVEVTQHTESDSDKWLLHEVDMDFRNYYGIPGKSYSRRQIDGQTVMEVVAGGRDYRWMSGNKVIMIEYYDSQLTKPEPLEVVKAYLSKHPSTLTPMGLAELRNDANKTTWIKEEIDRRLWLCDKWVEQKEQGKVDVDKLLREMHDHMKVFLNYREKYYGIAATDEKKAIYSYMQSKDEAAMKNKLTEYKSWWSANKDGAINL